MNKKGVSPVVATALLIALVFVLGGIVFLWAKGFLAEQIQKNGEAIEMQCQNIAWKVNYKKGIGNMYSLTIENRGQVNLYGFIVRRWKDSNSEQEKYVDDNYLIDAGMNKKINAVSFEYSSSILADEVEIIPVILGTVVGDEDTTKYYVCDTDTTTKAINLN